MISLTLAFQFITNVYAQQSISGKVTSEQTGKPIVGVHVFLSGSTFGILTNESGEYDLKGIQSRSFELIFSHIGYSPEVIEIERLSADTTINIVLSEGVFQLEDVSVFGARNRKWERFLKRFKPAFLGENFNESLISIENDYSIEFEDEKGVSFSIINEPILRIRNDFLGYNIYFQLLSFFQREGTSFLGYSKFEEIKPNNLEESRNWMENRDQVFRGSSRHLFQSIINGNWEEEGFGLTLISTEQSTHLIGHENQEVEVRTNVKVGQEPEKGDNLIIELTEEGTYLLYFFGYLEVYYFDEVDKNGDIQKTEISLAEPLEIYPNGVIKNPKAMITYGYWSSQGVFEMLPFEYMPKK